MGAPRFTEAELARAIRAARRAGGSMVEVERGVIRIRLDDSVTAPQVVDHHHDDGDAACDELFGVSR